MHETIKQQIKNLESAISKFELKDNIAVFRWADISMLDFFRQVKERDGFFQDDGFVSTTAVVPKSNYDNLIEMKIVVPAGIGRGAYIAPMSAFPKECEFVLQRGTIFKIAEIMKKENKYWQVTIFVVDCVPKDLDKI